MVSERLQCSFAGSCRTSRFCYHWIVPVIAAALCLPSTARSAGDTQEVPPGRDMPALDVVQDKDSSTWWVLGDSHVNHRLYNQQLSRAVADVKELGISDYAIVLGDCIDERTGEPRDNWDDFTHKMDVLPHGWTYVLGNHDNDGRTVPVTPVTTPNYFSVRVNGVRLIGISDEHIDESYNNDLEMSREQQQWFKAELNQDPDVPTIIMSHQDVSGLARESRSTVPFFHEWIEPNLGDYNIVLWVAAHAHAWHLAENVKGHGFTKLIVNDILYDQESAFMTIADHGDSATVTFRFRNHDRKEWISVGGHEEYTITVGVPLSANGGKPD